MRLRGLGRLLAPAYGTCLRCGTPWRFVEGKVVHYSIEGRNVSLPAEDLDLLRGRLEAIDSGVRLEWQPLGPDVVGLFALCTKCWDEAPLVDRVDAYSEVLKRQGDCTLPAWRSLALAVGAASGYGGAASGMGVVQWPEDL